MIYTVALIYIAVIVFLELCHKKEREKLFRTEKSSSVKVRKKHFSPHRKAIEKIRRNTE